MTRYNEIKTKVEECIELLKVDKFAKGAHKEVQDEVNNILDILDNLNDYIESVDDRVIVLEE